MVDADVASFTGILTAQVGWQSSECLQSSGSHLSNEPLAMALS